MNGWAGCALQKDTLLLKQVDLKSLQLGKGLHHPRGCFLGDCLLGGGTWGR